MFFLYIFILEKINQSIIHTIVAAFASSVHIRMIVT